MKAYWDSSALIQASQEADLRRRLALERGFSRRHSLAETFSALTGKPHIRVSASDAALLLEDLVQDLDFVELSTDEIIGAAKDAQALGVRGGRIHDLLHARAALKSGAKQLLTMDRHDFEKLVSGLSIEQV
jgi:predicted nucleic acid-binding protein